MTHSHTCVRQLWPSQGLVKPQWRSSQNTEGPSASVPSGLWSLGPLMLLLLEHGTCCAVEVTMSSESGTGVRILGQPLCSCATSDNHHQRSVPNVYHL